MFAYCSAKFWLAPDPELGVTETVEGTPEASGTVQVPNCCQPLLEPDKSAAYRKVPFAPVYPFWKTMGRFKVSVFPFRTAVVLTYSPSTGCWRACWQCRQWPTSPPCLHWYPWTPG